jgi:rhomboid protease GluP
MANCIRCGRKLPGLTFGKKICQWCVQHEAAQRGEIVEDAPQPVMTAPWARRRESGISLTHLLFGINVAVFLAMALASHSVEDFSLQLSVHFGANYGPLTLLGQWWRLFTYMFLHAGIFHIAINMWCLWSFGELCESLYGAPTYLAIYVITGIAGGVTSVAWNPGVWSVGASGALFGLTGALIASIYLGEFSYSDVYAGSVLTSLLFFCGFSLFFGFASPGIDNSCHIGGLISGLVLGTLIARLAPQRDQPLRRVAVIGIVAVGVTLSFLIVQNWRGSQLLFLLH